MEVSSAQLHQAFGSAPGADRPADDVSIFQPGIRMTGCGNVRINGYLFQRGVGWFPSCHGIRSDPDLVSIVSFCNFIRVSPTGDNSSRRAG